MGRPRVVRGLAQKMGGGTLGEGADLSLGHLNSSYHTLSPSLLLGPWPAWARAYLQGLLLDPKEKEKSLCSDTEGQGRHDTSKMFSDCPWVPAEPFLKGTSARVISKLTRTGALWNLGGHQALSKSVPVINSYIQLIVSSEENHLFLWAQLVSLIRHCLPRSLRCARN